MSARTFLEWALAALLVGGCGCRGGVGAECSAAGDCRDGLVCDPQSRTCREPPTATDAVPATDAVAPGSDANGPGTDATGPGTDATTPGSDAASPGSDAAMPGTDAMSGCASPPAPTDPVSCYQGCSSDGDCTWADSTCCCPCNMGGSSTAINTAYTSAWTARMTVQCAGVDCTGIGCLAVDLCPVLPPSCVMGLCM